MYVNVTFFREPWICDNMYLKVVFFAGRMMINNDNPLDLGVPNPWILGKFSTGHPLASSAGMDGTGTIAISPCFCNAIG